MIENPILYIFLWVGWGVVLCHIGMFHVYSFEDFYLVVKLLFVELFGCSLYGYVIGVVEDVDACL